MLALVALVALTFVAPVPFQRPESNEVSQQEQTVRARYEQALLANPSRGTAFERLYQSYLELEGTGAWRERLERLTTEDAERAAPWIVLGFVLERQGEESDALRAYTEAEQRDPENYRAPAARGRLLVHLRRYDEAGAALARAVQLNPPRQELQDLYKALGRIYARQGKMADAKRAWRDLANLFPRDATVSEELAELLVDEGELDEAIAQYQRLRALTEDDYVKVRAGHEIAELRLRQGKFDEATALFAELLDSLAPDSWLRAETRRRLDDAFHAKGELDALVRFYDDWIKRNEDDVEMRVALAAAHREMGQAAEAIDRYEEVLKRAGSRRDARLALAGLYLDQGRHTDAAGELRKAADSSPEDAALWEQLGTVLFDDLTRPETERREQARQAWLKIASERPADPLRAVRAAEVFRARQFDDDALEHYERAVRLAPENTVYYEYLGEFLHQLDRGDDAVARWREIVAGRRDTLANWQRLAEVLARFGYDDESLKAVAEGLKRAGDGPDGFKLVALRSDILLDQEKFDAASDALKELARRAESPAQRKDVMNRHVTWAQRSGRLDAEIAQLARELDHAQLTADHSPDFELLARLHVAASHLTEAIAAANRAVDLDPKSIDRLSLAADLYRQAGNMGRAIEILQRMTEIDPRQESLRLEEIAELARRQGDLKAAIAAGQGLIVLMPDAPRAYLLTSDIEWQAGGMDDAVATLRRGIRGSPRDLALHQQLARRLMETGKYQQALDQWWRTFETAEDASQKLRVTSDLARAHIDTGQFDRLIDRLSERRRDSSDEIVATLALASAYRQARRLDRAEQELVRALSKRPGDAQILEQLATVAEELRRPDQAIVYADKLAKLRPTDPLALRRLGRLLLDAGRVDEAIARLRASLAVTAADPATAAIELAETLTKHDLDREAHQTLADAAARYPDDWRLTFLLAMFFKHDRQLDRSRKMLDELITRRPPAAAITGGDPQRNPAYLDGGNRPAVVNQWLRLIQIRNATAGDFQGSARTQAYWLHNWHGSTQGGGGLHYYPPDFNSAQFAALVQRLHLAETEGELSQYLAQLARRAGYWLKLAEPIADQAPAALPVSARDPDARRVLLRSLLCVHLTDEAFRAARQFAVESPGDLDAETLLVALATAPRQGQDQHRYEKLIGNQTAFHGLWRPSAVTLDGFDVEPIMTRIAAEQPRAVLAFAIPQAISLIGQGRSADAARWIDWSFDQKPSPARQLVALKLLLDAGRTDQVLHRLPNVQAAIRDNSRPGGAAGQAPASGSRRRTRAVNPETNKAMLELAKLLFQRGEHAAALEFVVAHLDLTASASASQSAGATFSRTFWLGWPTPAKFPAPNAFFDKERLDQFKEWHERSAASGCLDLWRSQLENRLRLATESVAGRAGQAGSADPREFADAQADAAVTLAAADALADRLDAARERLAASADALNDDRLHLIVAQILLQQNRPAEAYDRFRKITAPAGQVAEESLVGQLQLAVRLDRPDAAREAALRLFGMRLGDSNTEHLQSHLRSLGLAPLAAQLQNRATSPAGRGNRATATAQGTVANRRVETLKQFVTSENHDAAIALARRIIADEAPSNDNDGEELNAAIAALDQLGELVAETERLEAERDVNPRSIETLTQLQVIYSAGGDQEKLRAVTEQLFAASPDNEKLRYEYARQLYAEGQVAAAVEQYERVLGEAPWVIDDGRWLAQAFLHINQAERLVDRVVAVEPVRRMSLQPQSVTLDWLDEVIQAIEEEYPELAVRVVRRQRDLEPIELSLPRSIAIVRLLIRTEAADELLAELARLQPSTLDSAGLSGTARRDFLLAAGEALFSCRFVTPGRWVNWEDAPAVESLFGDVVDLLSAREKMPAFEELLVAGAADADWSALIGRPARSLIALTSDRPDATAAVELIGQLESLPAPTSEVEQNWRGAVTDCLLGELARDPSRLELAARVARLRLPELRANKEYYFTRLRILSLLGRVALAADDRAKAREYYEEFAKLPDPNIGAGHGSYDEWRSFRGKQRQFECMRETGFGDIAIAALFACVEEYCDGNWRPHPCEELLGKWAASPGDANVLAEKTAWAEREFAERPNDFTAANRLVRYYRAAGRADDVPPLLERVLKMPGLSSNQVFAVADQLYGLGRQSVARESVLRQLADGERYWAEHAGYSDVRFRSVEDAEQLASLVESLPREPRFVEHGAGWIANLDSMIEQGLNDRPAPERRALREIALRIYRVADSFSAIIPPGDEGINRAHLESIARELEHLGRHDPAFELIHQSIFDAKSLGMPEPSFTTLFGEVQSDGFDASYLLSSVSGRGDWSGTRSSGTRYRLAEHLVWLAGKAGRTTELREAIEGRLKSDSVWTDTGLRLLALVEIDYGTADRAAEVLEQIVARPAPPTPGGTDLTPADLIIRAARRPELTAHACRLLPKLIDRLRLDTTRESDAVLLALFDSLARLNDRAGEPAAARAAVLRFQELMRKGSPGAAPVAHHLTARLLADTGQWSEAIEEYRRAMREPLPQGWSNWLRFGWFDGEGAGGVGGIFGDLPRRNDFVDWLVRIRDANQLDEWMARLRIDWEKSSGDPAGRRSCEPLVTLAICQVLAGDADAARETLGKISAADTPVGIGMLVDAASAAPRPADALPVVDEAFVRWPYLFDESSEKLAILHIRAGQALPLGNRRLVEYLEQLGPPGDPPNDRTGATPASTRPRGLVLSVRIAPDQQRSLTGQALDGISRVLDRSGRVDEYIAVMNLFTRHLGYPEEPFRWIAHLAHSDPARGYEVCCELLGAVPRSNQRQLQRFSPDSTSQQESMTLQELFAEQPTEIGVGRAVPDGSAVPAYPTLAALVIDVARRSDKLPDLIARCERVLDQTRSPSRGKGFETSPEVASRLQLLALAAVDPARFRERLPDFTRGSGAFRRESEESWYGEDETSSLDPALRAVAEACWISPALRAEAPRLLAVVRRPPADRRSKRRALDFDNSEPAHVAERLRVVEMEFELGERAAAIAGCRELLNDHIRACVQSEGEPVQGLSSEEFDRLFRIARRHHAEREMCDLISAAREQLAAFPVAARRVAEAERQFHIALGDSVTPGIALAVQPAGHARLRFIWQLHHELPESPDDAENIEQSDADPSVWSHVTVPFVDASRAIDPAGYTVRLEAAADRRSFVAIATVPASGGRPNHADGSATATALAGAVALELAAPAGSLRWYRAQLLSGDKVVAMSHPVAGVAGDNLLAAGSVGPDRADSSRPAGWYDAAWSHGRAELETMELPGLGPTRWATSGNDAAFCLEAPSIAIQYGRGLVLTVWTHPELRSSDARRGDRSNTDRRSFASPRAQSQVQVEFFGRHEQLVGEQATASPTSPRFCFQQLVIEPASAGATAGQRATVFPEASYNSRGIPAGATSFKASLAAEPGASIGNVSVLDFSFDNHCGPH
jgi:tetratricopeptide (TPR) repeat protein